MIRLCEPAKDLIPFGEYAKPIVSLSLVLPTLTDNCIALSNGYTLAQRHNESCIRVAKIPCLRSLQWAALVLTYVEREQELLPPALQGSEHGFSKSVAAAETKHILPMRLQVRLHAGDCMRILSTQAWCAYSVW